MSSWESSEAHVRVLSYLCIHCVAQENPHMRKFCLKGLYSTYVKNSKFLSKHTSSALQFMENCCVEIFGLHISGAYEHVFRYIRQLAVLMRIAMTTTKKETVQKIYNWQYISSIKLLCRIISTYKEVLKELIYPAAQVLIATIKLIPTAQYFPLRFHCLKALRELSPSGSPFIPMLHFITEVLGSVYVKNKPQNFSSKATDTEFTLRFKKNFLGSKLFQDFVINSVIHELYAYFSESSYHVAFPELALPVMVQLKHFLLNTKNLRLSRELKQLLSLIKKTIVFIGFERLNVLKANMTSTSKQTPIDEFFYRWRSY
ncbi:nucleolar complex protein 2 homolog [Zophobas morio]|uniref:nucleolar complex protein 2 homolog n=1 Tax=Zophobas morio TaxID=2755281 RepID=UPI0030833DBF